MLLFFSFRRFKEYQRTQFMYCILILHYITGMETTFGGYSNMLPSANALCVRLGVLLVCSMWKCRIQVLQRTMTSQTMCWCLAYSPLSSPWFGKGRIEQAFKTSDSAFYIQISSQLQITTHRLSNRVVFWELDEWISCPLLLRAANAKAITEAALTSMDLCWIPASSERGKVFNNGTQK